MINCVFLYKICCPFLQTFFIKYLVHFYKHSYQISCPFFQTFFIKYVVHFNKHSLSNILSIFANILYQIFCPFLKKHSLSNILSIFANILYQISCPILQTLFIKYLVHFCKRSLSNILSIFTNHCVVCFSSIYGF